MAPERPRIAIIGAGVSGLAAALRLQASGAPAVVFDKGRGVGGRMSTRRSNAGDSFDHGAQYFTVRDDRFRQAVARWQSAGVVQQWRGRIGVIDDGEVRFSSLVRDRFVGVPTMSAVCRHLAEGRDVRTSVRVTSVTREGALWRLSDENGAPLGDFGAVLSTAPAAQTAQLLAEVPAVAAAAKATPMRPCWTVMLGFDEPLPASFDGAFINIGPLSWVARNNSKPGRPAAERWVLHATADWTEENLELAPADVIERLTAALFETARLPPTAPCSSAAHLWRYARPDEPLEDRYIADENLGVYACGDWCGGPRVEGAYLSGIAVAEAILGVS